MEAGQAEQEFGSCRERAVMELKALLKEKDYYVLTSLTEDDLAALKFDGSHMAAPCDVSCTEEAWEAYLKWLSFTLNRETILLELGEGFLNPAVIRWPFEKTAALNQKAFLFRIHSRFAQIPDELKGKAVSVSCNSLEFTELLGIPSIP